MGAYKSTWALVGGVHGEHAPPILPLISLSKKPTDA